MHQRALELCLGPQVRRTRLANVAKPPMTFDVFHLFGKVKPSWIWKKASQDCQQGRSNAWSFHRMTTSAMRQKNAVCSLPLYGAKIRSCYVLVVWILWGDRYTSLSEMTCWILAILFWCELPARVYFHWHHCTFSKLQHKRIWWRTMKNGMMKLDYICQWWNISLDHFPPFDLWFKPFRKRGKVAEKARAVRGTASSKLESKCLVSCGCQPVRAEMCQNGTFKVAFEFDNISIHIIFFRSYLIWSQMWKPRPILFLSSMSEIILNPSKSKKLHAKVKWRNSFSSAYLQTSQETSMVFFTVFATIDSLTLLVAMTGLLLSSAFSLKAIADLEYVTWRLFGCHLLKGCHLRKAPTLYNWGILRLIWRWLRFKLRIFKGPCWSAVLKHWGILEGVTDPCGCGELHLSLVYCLPRDMWDCSLKLLYPSQRVLNLTGLDQFGGFLLSLLSITQATGCCLGLGSTDLSSQLHRWTLEPLVLLVFY